MTSIVNILKLLVPIDFQTSDKVHEYLAGCGCDILSTPVPDGGAKVFFVEGW